MKRYAFNGYLFSQRPTGVMRYAFEMLQELDKIQGAEYFELVIPEYAKDYPKLKNIRIVKYGTMRGNLWEQVSFVKYLKRSKRISVNFNNTIPFFAPGIIVIHDIAYKIHPEFFPSLHGKLSIIYHRLAYSWASKCNYSIITVTYFSRDQLINTYHIDSERIKVIGNGWQHMNRINVDNNALDKYSLTKGTYYFTLGSVSKMKNTKWVIEVAKRNPQKLFIVGGGIPKSEKNSYNDTSNLKFLGFVTNEEMKCLIKNCKAFIYPSLFDGFGIPPMEALSQDVNVICSNAACLPEIYGSSVHYIDPYDYSVDIDKLLNQPVYGQEEVLKKYSWETTAQKFMNLLKS